MAKRKKKTVRRTTAASKTSRKSPPIQSVFGMKTAELDHLLSVLKKHDIATFEWEKGSQRICIQSGMVMDAPMAPRVSEVVRESAPSVESVPAVPELSSASSSPRLQPNEKEIVSPFVGTFYRKPSPDADAYVSEGQQVKKGDVLCIVEAMKLMNEIEADFSGKITKIYVEDAQPVEYGEPLFVIAT